MSKVFVFLTILFSIQLAHARKPAVDPVVGISIEEYKEVPPEKAKGFNFNQARKPDAAQRVHNSAEIREGSASDTAGAENLLVVFLVFLPVIAAGMTFYLLKKEQPEEIKSDNVVDIFAKKKDDNDDDHDDYNFPKAS
jgi:hypothetical protein